jgi:organic hydroperoxide reductase OsmC/OhrA
MTDKHLYRVRIDWTGNRGEGTQSYRTYGRDHTIHIEGKPDIAASSDPSFRGDPSRHNPEDLFVASLSSCHMLWYLHLCSVNGISVLSYVDDALGVMELDATGAGHFTSVTLKPVITIASGGDPARAASLHTDANKMCFVANSVKCLVHHEPVIQIAEV